MHQVTNVINQLAVVVTDLVIGLGYQFRELFKSIFPQVFLVSLRVASVFFKHLDDIFHH